MLIIMGMLLPSLVKARESGKRVQCASNLKQIGLSLRPYSIDAREWFPNPYPPVTLSTDTLETKIALDRLVEGLYLTAGKTYNCPSTRDETWIDSDNHIVDISYLFLVDEVGPLSEAQAGANTTLGADRLSNHTSPNGGSEFGNALASDGRVQGFHGAAWWEDSSITESMRDYIVK